MRKSGFVVTASLAWLCGVASVIDAQPQLPSCGEAPSTRVFNATGSIQTYDVPESASTVLIEAYGAAGGDNDTAIIDGKVVATQVASYVGGFGAYVIAEVPVVGGESLNVVVGEMGETGGPGGGGGASAVLTTSDVPLIVAGAGGGAGAYENGSDAELTPDGSAGGGLYGGAGGTDGGGGGAATIDAAAAAGGGGGLLTDGGTSAIAGSAGGGHALTGDAAGGTAGDSGAAGGYGGGGGSTGVGGGGGAGYSGGGGGYGGGVDGGGSGGSFADADALQSFFFVRSSQGDGQVTICVGPNSETVPAMPWASLALLALGLLAAGIAALKRLA